jgi:hypothetical protein
MLKLLITIVAEDMETVRGIIFQSEDESYRYYPKRLKYYNYRRRLIEIDFHEASSPEGTWAFATRDQAMRFLSMSADEEVICELSEERKERLRITREDLVKDVDAVSNHFNLGDERLVLTDRGKEVVDFIMLSPSQRYARSDRGRESQKRWRNSKSGRIMVQENAKVKKETNALFKEAAKWLEDHPGKTFSDWEKQA